MRLRAEADTGAAPEGSLLTGETGAAPRRSEQAVQR